MLEIGEQLRQHAEWFEGQMPAIVLPREASRDAGPFEAADDASLHAVAAAAPADEETPPAVAAARADSSHRGNRHLWRAVAAAAVIALVVASVAVVRSRGGRSRPTTPTAPTSGLIATGHDSVLLPTSMAPGLLATDVTTSSLGTGRGPTTGVGPGVPAASQLFGADGVPELELTISPSHTPVDQVLGTAETVRGTAGRLISAGQPTEVRNANGVSYTYLWDAIDDRYTWDEHGAYVTANFRHLTPQRALEIIDGLRWVSADPSEGFLPASASGLSALLPISPPQSSGLGLEADIDEVAQPADSTSLKLVTCPGGSGACEGITYDYATAWLNGTRAADGSVTMSADGERAANGTSTEGTYLRIWPDGAAYQVGFGEAQPVDVDLARRVTAGIAVTDQAGLDRFEAGVSAGLRALPVIAAADLPGGRVEVRGAGEVSLTCLTPTGAGPSCSSGVLPIDGQPPTGGITASAIVGGHWIVGVSSTSPGPLAFNSGDTVDFNHPAGPPLPGQTTAETVGTTTYQLGLVEVPDGVTGIMITQSTPGGGIGGGAVERPSS
jgi:hypothetical protein